MSFRTGMTSGENNDTTDLITYQDENREYLDQGITNPQQEPVEPFSTRLPSSVVRSLHIFCAHTDNKIHDIVCCAISSYLIEHASELPKAVTISAVIPDMTAQPGEKHCGFKNCNGVIVAYGSYGKDQKETPLCMNHLTLARSDHRNWKVVRKV